MENERFGLIAAILQNGIPTGSPVKNAKVHKPSEYFKPAVKVKEPKKPALQTLYDKMRSVCAMMGGNRNV
jgi:hypothetical protein